MESVTDRRLVRYFDLACWMVTRSVSLRAPDLAFPMESSRVPDSASSIEKVENSASMMVFAMDRRSVLYWAPKTGGRSVALW